MFVLAFVKKRSTIRFHGWCFGFPNETHLKWYALNDILHRPTVNLDNYSLSVFCHTKVRARTLNWGNDLFQDLN